MCFCHFVTFLWKFKSTNISVRHTSPPITVFSSKDVLVICVIDETLNAHSELVNLNWKDSAGSVLDVYRELIQTGLRIWVFRFVLKFKVLYHEKKQLVYAHIDKQVLIILHCITATWVDLVVNLLAVNQDHENSKKAQASLNPQTYLKKKNKHSL